MSFTASSIGATANCAKALADAIHPLLTAAGFTHVEDWTSSTKTARIYKSPAASNSFGSDWYLNVYRSSDTATGLSLFVAEAYNGTTKRFTNFAPNTQSLTPTASFAVNDTGVLPDGSGGSVAAMSTSYPIGVGTGGYQYWLSAHPNRVVLATRVGTTDCATYAGLYDDTLQSSGSPFPLVTCALDTQASTSTSSGGRATREPFTTTSNQYNFFVVPAPFGAGGVAGPSASDTYESKVIPVKAMVMGRGVQGNAFRGSFKDLLATYLVAGANGDTLTIGAKTYYRISHFVTAVGNQYWVDGSI
jgi:hypothetical protein